MNIKVVGLIILLFPLIFLNLIITSIGKNVQILDTETDYFKRSLSEMLFINSDKNNINLKEDVSKLNRIYSSLSF